MGVVSRRAAALLLAVGAAGLVLAVVTVSPASAGAASELLLKAVHSPLGAPAPSARASHAARRTAAAAAAASVKDDVAKTKHKGTATPLFASAAVAARAAAAAKAAPKPSSKFLRHEVASAGKAAVRVAAMAKAASASAASASKTAAGQSKKASLVRARIAKMPLHTAMNFVEAGAAHSLAQADKNAVEAALLRAALSVPGQRKAEKAAAAAAARAAANKPSAAWLAGAKSLADRDPYAAMRVHRTQQQQLRQQGSNAQTRGRPAAGKPSRAARAHRGRHALSRRSALSHTGYSRDEDEAYTVQAGNHPLDVGGNDKIIATLPRNEEGGIDRPDPARSEYVKKTRSLGTPVEPFAVQKHWAHGHYHPYSIVKQDDRYVPVGRLLTHRGGVTRREMKMPTMEEEEEGGVMTEEEQPEEEEEEEEDCQWGKDVYGRCYKECTPSKDDYSKCHDGSPIWQDPVPLNKLCVGHENATWCQEPEGEEGGEGDEGGEDKARTVQLASVGGNQGEVLGGSAGAQNAANAPTLAGGVPVAGGKVVWLPLNALSNGAQGKAEGVVTQAPVAAFGNNFVTAPPAQVTPEVPKWDPKKFSKEVLYGPNGKPLYAFYARSDEAPASPAGQTGAEQQLAGGRKGAADTANSAGLSEADKEIERKVLFKLLREEQEEAAQLREQRLADDSAGGRVASSWGASLLVSVAAVVVPLLALH